MEVKQWVPVLSYAEEQGLKKKKHGNINHNKFKIKELEKKLRKKEKELQQEKEKVVIIKKSLRIFMEQYFQRDIVLSLVETLESFHDYTGGHSLEVAFLSKRIGKALNLTNKEIDYLCWSSILHDIGKISIDKAILSKTCRLTDTGL